MENKKESPLDPINNAPSEITKIIKRILRLEKDKLSQKKPHINSDIIKVIKEEIQ